MDNPSVRKIVKFKLDGYTVTMKILAYRDLADEEVRSCIYDYVNSKKRKKLRKDITVIVSTIMGAAPGI